MPYLPSPSGDGLTWEDCQGTLDNRGRYSRYQLRIAARAREPVDQGIPIEAACRIIILEEAQRINAEYRRTGESSSPSAAA